MVGGEFFGVEGVDPLVKRGKVVWVGLDGLGLLFPCSLAEEVEGSFAVGEWIRLIDGGGVCDNGRGVRGRRLGG